MKQYRLKKTREARKLSQKDLADRIGISDKQIWRYETGLSDPTTGILTLLAKELEVSSDYLLGLIDKPSDHYREDELSPQERSLIRALRAGRVIEALESVVSLLSSKDIAGNVASAIESGLEDKDSLDATDKP